VGALILISLLIAAAPVPSAAQEVHAFDVPTSDPASAIRTFVLQSGWQILASADDLKGKTLNPVSGDISVEDGLKELLAGTGLEHRYVGEHAVALVSESAVPTAAAPAPKKTKPAVSSGDSSAPPASDNATVEEVVVTARMRSEKLLDVPISTSVFSQNEISDARINGPSDFIALSPNVSLVQSATVGTSFMTIRGISQVRNGEPPVATVVDGVELVNSAQFTQDLIDIQQIELLRGPQGALYGRDASGGAILITTRQPTNDFQGQVTGGVGLGDEVEGTASFSGPIVADKLLFQVGVHYDDRQGYDENITLDRKVDPYMGETLHSMVRWLIDDDTTADLRANVGHVVDGANNFVYQPTLFGPDGKRLAPGNDPFDFNSPAINANNTSIPFTANYIGYNTRDIDEFSLKLDHHFAFATLTSVSAFNRVVEFMSTKAAPYTADLTSQTVIGATNGTFTQYLAVNAPSEELRLTSPSDQSLRWMVGGYYLHTNRFISTTSGTDLGMGIVPIYEMPEFTSTTNPTTVFDADDNVNKSWAVFTNWEYDLTKQLEAAVAYRYDEDQHTQYVSPLQTGGQPGAVNRVTFSKGQPKVSLRYSIDPRLSVYASWGVGFRSGEFNQNGTGAAAALIGLPGVSDLLKAETVTTTEGGLKADLFDHHTRLEVSGFSTSQKNAPYFVFVAPIGAQVLVGIDKVALYGGELTLTQNFARGLDAFLGYGYTHSQIKNYALTPADVGNQAPYVPNQSIDAGVQYRVAMTSRVDLFARLQYQRLGKQYWDPENSTPRDPVDLVGLRLGLESPDSRWSVIATVNNLFDTRYNAEWVDGGFALLAPPRTGVLEFTYKF
jgi:iron complex outermembrane receptor protein